MPEETQPREQSEFSAAPCSASGLLLSKWRQTIQERDKEISNRLDNMFFGPLGIEERIEFLENDARMNAWFLNKLIEVVSDIESRMPNAPHELPERE
jgi:hypothetical protein